MPSPHATPRGRSIGAHPMLTAVVTASLLALLSGCGMVSISSSENTSAEGSPTASPTSPSTTPTLITLTTPLASVKQGDTIHLHGTARLRDSRVSIEISSRLHGGNWAPIATVQSEAQAADQSTYSHQVVVRASGTIQYRAVIKGSSVGAQSEPLTITAQPVDLTLGTQGALVTRDGKEIGGVTNDAVIAAISERFGPPTNRLKRDARTCPGLTTSGTEEVIWEKAGLAVMVGPAASGAPRPASRIRGWGHDVRDGSALRLATTASVGVGTTLATVQQAYPGGTMDSTYAKESTYHYRHPTSGTVVIFHQNANTAPVAGVTGGFQCGAGG